MADMGRASRWVVAGVTALFACACHPVEHRGHIHFSGPETGFMQVNSRLDCPDTSGDLKRTSLSADGTSCSYAGPNEEAVSLTLTPLAGADPQAVLTRLEAQLEGDTGLSALAPPAPPQPPAPPAAKSKDWDAGGHAKTDDDKDDDDDDDESSAPKKGAPTNDHTKIDLPGVHISTNGDKADVSLPGISIHANGDNAEVHAGWWGHSATIVGNDGGATIRLGRADSSGVDCMMFVKSNRPGPTGYRSTGYIAKGPPGGPLVIATFKAKSEYQNDHDPAGDGVKALVQINVHQGLGWFSDDTARGGKDAKP